LNDSERFILFVTTCEKIEELFFHPVQIQIPYIFSPRTFLKL
jgi:hypothetical protein